MKDTSATTKYISDIAGGLTGAGIRDPIASVLGPVFDFLKSAGLVVGLFLIGIILAGLGIWTIVSHTSGGKAAKKAVKVAALV